MKSLWVNHSSFEPRQSSLTTSVVVNSCRWDAHWHISFLHRTNYYLYGISEWNNSFNKPSRANYCYLLWLSFRSCTMDSIIRRRVDWSMAPMLGFSPVSRSTPTSLLKVEYQQPTCGQSVKFITPHTLVTQEGTTAKSTITIAADGEKMISDKIEIINLTHERF